MRPDRVRVRLLTLAMLALTAVAASEAPAPARSTPDVQPQIIIHSATPTTTQLALGDLAVTYFTVLNSGPDNITISIGSGDGNCVMFFVFEPINGRSSGFPVVLAPSELQQVRVIANNLTATTTCTNDVTFNNLTTGANGSLPVTITFTIGATAGSVLDVEPEDGLDYGTRFTADPVVQSLRIANLGGSPASETVTLPPASGLTFAGTDGHCAPGSQTCVFATGSDSGGGGTELDVTCTPQTGDSTAVIVVFDGTNSVNLPVTCTNEVAAMSGISAMDLGIAGMPGMPATGMVTLTASVGGETLSDAYILYGSGASAIHFDPSVCANGTYCSFGSGRAVGPLAIDCTPTLSPQFATLIVHGTGGLDTAVANIACGNGTMTGTDPVITISPGSLAFGLQPVDTSSSQTVTISAGGMAGPLTDVAVSIDDTVNYSIDCGASPCSSLGSVDSGGAVVTVTFDPTAPADFSTLLHVTSSNATPSQITVDGVGQGATITLIQPGSDDISFGNIGRNSPQTATLQIQNTGNLATDTTASLSATGAALFSLSGSDIPLSPNAMGQLTLSCGSNTAGSASGTVTLATPAAYQGSSFPISVSCTVADTDVSATPVMKLFGDTFGELRRDANVAAQQQTITLTNNGPSTSTIGAVTMSQMSGHVTFTQPGTTLLAGNGGTTTFTITADPNVDNGSGTFDEDFSTTPLVLTIPIDLTSLNVTVTGKVVKAQTALSPAPPAPLDLGTLCIGSTANGTVTLTNTGTAHVGVPSAPTMDEAFAITGYTGTTELAPGSASVQTAMVAPIRSDQAGELDGMLTWNTDVPDAYLLAVKLVYVAGGGAVSPATLAFAAQKAGTESQTQTINVQNCDTVPLDVTIGDLVQHVGPTSAWNVMPPASMTLQPSAVTPVTVAFRPHLAGHFYAELPITAGSATTVVELTGDGTGLAQAAETDFYACGCHGSGVPTQGWPVGVVIVLVVRRRRSRKI